MGGGYEFGVHQIKHKLGSECSSCCQSDSILRELGNLLPPCIHTNHQMDNKQRMGYPFQLIFVSYRLTIFMMLQKLT